MTVATLSELATLVHGRLIGNENPEIRDALPLQDASSGCLTLADHPKHLVRVAASKAAAVMVREELVGCTKPMLVVSNLHAAFQQVIGFLRPKRLLQPAAPGVNVSASVHTTVCVGEGTSLAAGVTVGEHCEIGRRCVLHAGVSLMPGCQIGDDCELLPNVILYPDTILGSRVLIHAGAVLGAYGFGYRLEQGRHVRTAQLGWVEIEDDVEIGACTTIDRGTYGPTRIGAGTKIDNQVQIGHNCHIGRHNLICAQVGIAGSTSTGDRVVLAGQVGIADHLHLADDVTVGAQAGVIGNIEKGAVIVGSPAAPRRRRMLEWALIERLPEMRQQLKEMQHKIHNLEELLEDNHSSLPSRQRPAA